MFLMGGLRTVSLIRAPLKTLKNKFSMNTLPQRRLFNTDLSE